MPRHNGVNAVTFENSFGEEKTLRKTERRGWQVQQDIGPIGAMGRSTGRLIGEKIRKIRTEKGMTMRELGIQVLPGYSDYAIKVRIQEIETASKYRKDGQTYGIRIGTLYAIAFALGVTPSSLLPSMEEVMKESGVKLAAKDQLIV